MNWLKAVNFFDSFLVSKTCSQELILILLKLKNKYGIFSWTLFLLTSTTEFLTARISADEKFLLPFSNECLPKFFYWFFFVNCNRWHYFVDIHYLVGILANFSNQLTAFQRKGFGIEPLAVIGGIVVGTNFCPILASVICRGPSYAPRILVETSRQVNSNWWIFQRLHRTGQKPQKNQKMMPHF